MFVIDVKIVKLLEQRDGVNQRTGKPWSAKTYLAEYQDGDKTKQFSFTVFSENLEIVVGAWMQISCDIMAREWNGKYYNTIRCYKAYTNSKPKREEKTALKTNVMEKPITVDASGRGIVDDKKEEKEDNHKSGDVTADDLPF